MKEYICLFFTGDTTQYFSCSNIPLVNAKLHQLNWPLSECVLCQLISGFYHPVAKITTPYVYPLTLIPSLQVYIARYELAVNNLPKNFNHYVKFLSMPKS